MPRYSFDDFELVEDQHIYLKGRGRVWRWVPENNNGMPLFIIISKRQLPQFEELCGGELEAVLPDDCFWTPDKFHFHGDLQMAKVNPKAVDIAWRRDGETGFVVEHPVKPFNQFMCVDVDDETGGYFGQIRVLEMGDDDEDIEILNDDGNTFPLTPEGLKAAKHLVVNSFTRLKACYLKAARHTAADE